MQKADFKEHFRRNYVLAYPVVLSQLGQVMVGVMDSIMVGRAGTLPLAGASLATSIFNVVLMFGIGVSFAMTPMVARAHGAREVRSVTSYFKHGLVINLLMGALLFLLLFFSGELLQYMNQPADVVVEAKPYLFIISCSIFPFMAFMSFKQFAEGLSQTKQAMVITISANLLNIFLNYLLIFGKWGFPRLELIGAGYATLISRIVMALLMWAYVQKSFRYEKYRAKWSEVKVRWKQINELLHIGIPTGFQYVFEVGAFAFSAVMIGWLGTKALAAHQIAISLASVTYMMASGVGAAATVRVGNQLGQKDIPTMKMAAYTCYAMVALFMGVACIVFIFGKEFLPSLYIQDPEVISIASTLLVIAAFFQLSDGMQVIGLGNLRGLADVKVPSLITLVAYWVIGIPVGYGLGFELGWGVQGIWYGLLVGLSMAAILLLIRFLRLSKRLAASS